MAINAGWHVKNPMPRGAKMDERIRWHLAHAKACGCRPIPARVAEAIRERRRRSTTSSRSLRVGTELMARDGRTAT
jgi:hypothetical protein